MQAEINIGTVGHVDHGKSTLVHQLTGRKTDTHSQEIKRGITIKLGYADALVRKCEKCGSFSVKETCPCGGKTLPVRTISFVDAPGHETLMATVIAASSVMDGALFVIAANEKCPQPQTAEHLMILEASGIQNVIIVQNKIDLVTRQRAQDHAKEIKAFLKGTRFEGAPIVPTAAQAGVNLDVLLSAIQEVIPTPDRKADSEKLRMHVVRSFDVNKPGTSLSKLTGGVLGVAIKSGRLAKGEKLEIVPGVLRQKKSKESYDPIVTHVLEIHAGSTSLETAGPGGLIALASDLDPSLSKGDALVGCLVGKPGTLPSASSELTVEITPMPRLLEKFAPTFAQNEPLVLGAGTSTTVGFVTGMKKKSVHLVLKKPLCVEEGDLIAVMRRSQNRWRVFGTAKKTG